MANCIQLREVSRTVTVLLMRLKESRNTNRGIHMSIQEALLIIEMADHDSVTAIDFIEALETVEA